MGTIESGPVTLCSYDDSYLMTGSVAPRFAPHGVGCDRTLSDESAAPILGLLHHEIPENRLTLCWTFGHIVNGQRAITADTALRLSRFFGTTAEFWLNLQVHYDLEDASRTESRKIDREVKTLATIA